MYLPHGSGPLPPWMALRMAMNVTLPLYFGLRLGQQLLECSVIGDSEYGFSSHASGFGFGFGSTDRLDFDLDIQVQVDYGNL